MLRRITEQRAFPVFEKTKEVIKTASIEKKMPMSRLIENGLKDIPNLDIKDSEVCFLSLNLSKEATAKLENQVAFIVSEFLESLIKDK